MIELNLNSNPERLVLNRNFGEMSGGVDWGGNCRYSDYEQGI